MPNPLTIVLWSGGGTLALIALFRYERARGARVLRGIRMAFDHGLEDTKFRIERLTTKAIRQTIHYIFHRILTALLRTIQRMEKSVHSITRLNKSRANRREATATSHFSVIADHKRNSKLSDTQMQQRRDEALLGR